MVDQPTASLYSVGYFGVHYYGVGAPPVDPRASTLQVRSWRYGSIRGNWTLPPDQEWERIRVVRSLTGWPQTVEDGITIVDLPGDTAIDEFQDDRLPRGQMIYYTLFVRGEFINLWTIAGQHHAVVTTNFNGPRNLYHALPETYRVSDYHLGSPGPLEKFTALIGVQTDHIRTELELLRKARDIRSTPGPFLTPYAAERGIDNEAELGGTTMRRLIRDSIFIYKRKGSIQGVRAFVTALTGWASKVSYDHASKEVRIRLVADRINFVPNASAELDTSGWSPIPATEVTLVRDTSRAASGASSFRLSRLGPGAIGMASDLIDFSSVVDGWFKGEIDWHFSMKIYSDQTGPLIRLRVAWLGPGGLEEIHTNDPSTLIGGQWNELDRSCRSPSWATHFRLELVGEAQNMVWVDDIMMEPSLNAQPFFSAATNPGDALWSGGTHASASHFYRRRSLKQSRLMDLLPEHLPMMSGVAVRLYLADGAVQVTKDGVFGG